MEQEPTLSYTYSSVKREIICGPEVISRVFDSLDRLGARRAMIVCGPSILRSSDVIERVESALGGRCAGTFSGVAPHAPVEVLQEAVGLARELQPEALVSVGGGSTHDTSKGIVTLLAEGGDIHDHAAHFEPPDRVTVPDFPHQKIPIIAVPTTMGGAEVSRGGGFTDKALGRKISVLDPGAIPRVIIIDGKALATTPMNVLLSTAMGQFRIAVECIYSTRHNPIADAISLHAIRLLMEHLPRCQDRDIGTLLNVKTAAMMASIPWVGGLGLNTAIAHHVGGLYGVQHGEANAILLPYTMRFNLDASGDRQAMIAQAMGISTDGRSDEETGLEASDGVFALCRRLGLPARLRDVGVPAEGLEIIAAATLHDFSLATNPKPITDAWPIMAVLREAW